MADPSTVAATAAATTVAGEGSALLSTAADFTSILLGAASLAVSYVALRVARIAMRRSDRNASASTIVTLYESLRQGWARYQDEDSDADRCFYEMSELMNTCEIACAIHRDESIHGPPRQVLQEYLCATLSKMGQDEQAAECIRRMIDGPTTFEFIAEFLNRMRFKGLIDEAVITNLGFVVRRPGQ